MRNASLVLTVIFLTLTLNASTAEKGPPAWLEVLSSSSEGIPARQAQRHSYDRFPERALSSQVDKEFVGTSQKVVACVSSAAANL